MSAVDSLRALARLPVLALLLAAAAPWLAGGLAAGPAVIAGRASVVDGDTIEIHGRRIRLAGIDAPESRQRCDRDGRSWACGKAAAFALADRIGSATVICEAGSHDRYGRLIAVCTASGEELNRWMVMQGWAVAYRRYSQAYAGAETDARANRRGIWAARFDMPWTWRKNARQSSPAS
jgi:endonuclease YncB( thermonuclease family)